MSAEECFAWKDAPDWVMQCRRSKTPLGLDVVVLDAHTGHTVGFDQLVELSEIFGTKAINVGTEERHEGYCETCRYTWECTVVTVIGPTKWPEELTRE